MANRGKRCRCRDSAIHRCRGRVRATASPGHVPSARLPRTKRRNRADKREDAAPDDLDANAEQDERGETQEDLRAGGAEARVKRSALRNSSQIDSARSAAPRAAPTIETVHALTPRGTCAPSVMAIEIDPGPTVSGSVMG